MCSVGRHEVLKSRTLSEIVLEEYFLFTKFTILLGKKSYSSAIYFFAFDYCKRMISRRDKSFYAINPVMSLRICDKSFYEFKTSTSCKKKLSSAIKSTPKRREI